MAGADWVDGRKLVGLAAGGLGALATALVLVPFRTDIDNANLALLLVLVVVLAAVIGDRSAAVVAAVITSIPYSTRDAR